MEATNVPHLRLFGSPAIRLQGREVTPARKHLALLTLLACSHPNGSRRTEICRLLWPQSSESSGRHSLSQALYAIRKMLGQSAVHADAVETLFLGDISCDVVGFEDCLAQGDWDGAASRYLGDLLTDTDFPNCVDLNQWLDANRARLRGRAESLLDEPLEPVSRNQLYLSLGKEVVSGIGEAAPSAIRFVGRVSELALLEMVRAESAAGELAVVFVRGEAGIGKSALCSRFVKKAVLNGSRVLTASGFQVESNLPLGVLRQLFRAPSSPPALNARLPLGEQSERGADKTGTLHAGLRGIEGIYEVAIAAEEGLRNVAGQGHLVAFVDDLQWADATSVAVLHHLSHMMADEPIMLVLASRPDDRVVDLLEGWPYSRKIELQGIGRESIRSLVATPEAPFDEVERRTELIEAISGGNPLSISMLLAQPSDADGTPPSTSQDLLSGKIAGLSAPAKAVGAALSLTRAKPNPESLAWLSAVGEDDVEAAVAELLSQSLIVLDRQDGRLSFKHDLIADAFLQSQSPVAQAELHGRVGRFLEHEGLPPAVVATHFAIAGSTAEACKTAMRAAESSLELFAHREAEYFLRIAITHADDKLVEISARTVLADVLLRQGRHQEADAVLHGLGETSNLTIEQSARVEAFRLLTRLTKPDGPSTVRGAYEHAAELEPELPESLAGRLYYAVASNAHNLGLSGLACRASESALAALHRGEETPEHDKYQVLASVINAAHGGVARDAAKLDEIIERRADAPDTLAAALKARAFLSHVSGQAAFAESDLLRGIDICKRFGLIAQRVGFYGNLGVCYMEQGRWAEASRILELALEAGPTTAPNGYRNALANAQILAYETGSYQEALSRGRELLATADELRLSYSDLGAIGVIGLAHLALGELSKARESERTLQIEIDRFGHLCHDVSYVELLLARMAVLSGHRKSAMRRLRQQVNSVRGRDYYCAGRMELEWLRLAGDEDPERSLQRARELRQELARAHAVPLVEALDGLITRWDGRVS